MLEDLLTNQTQFALWLQENCKDCFGDEEHNHITMHLKICQAEAQITGHFFLMPRNVQDIFFWNVNVSEVGCSIQTFMFDYELRIPFYLNRYNTKQAKYWLR